MIVELFGLPSSGKTTLAKEIEKNSNFKIIKVFRWRERIFYNLVNLLMHPINFFACFYFIISNSNSPALFYYKFMNFFIDTNARYQKARQSEKSILDQGYFQNLLSVFEKPIDSKLLKKYARFLIKPDLLIILNPSQLEIVNRTEARGYYSRKKFGEKYVDSWKNTTKNNFDLFLREIDTLGINHIVVNEKYEIKSVLNKISSL